MTNMTTEDIRFLADRERAIETLRAAAASALMLGVSEADIDTTVQAGLSEFAGTYIVQRSQDRAHALLAGASNVPSQRDRDREDVETGQASQPAPSRTLLALFERPAYAVPDSFAA